MKKTLTIILSLALTCILALSAFAATAEEAEDIALENAGFTRDDVVLDVTEKDEKDAKYEVEFKVKTDDPEKELEFEYDIDAKNGKILAVSIEYPDLVWGPEKNLTEAEAKEIALKHFGKTNVKALEIEYDEKDNKYEISFIDDIKEVEIEVSAFDGTVTEYEFELIAGGNEAIANFVAFIRNFIVMIKNLLGL